MLQCLCLAKCAYYEFHLISAQRGAGKSGFLPLTTHTTLEANGTAGALSSSGDQWPVPCTPCRPQPQAGTVAPAGQAETQTETLRKLQGSLLPGWPETGIPQILAARESQQEPEKF